MSCTKTAEPIEMPFGLWTRMVQGSMYYMGVQIPPCKGAIFREEKGCPTPMGCAKTAELIKIITGSFPTNVIAHLHSLSMDLTVSRTVSPTVDSTLG